MSVTVNRRIELARRDVHEIGTIIEDSGAGPIGSFIVEMNLWEISMISILLFSFEVLSEILEKTMRELECQ